MIPSARRVTEKERGKRKDINISQQKVVEVSKRDKDVQSKKIVRISWGAGAGVWGKGSNRKLKKPQKD